MSKTAATLKNCPFCGAPGQRLVLPYESFGCENPDCPVLPEARSLLEWNTRAPPTVCPDGLPVDDPQSRYWWRSADGTFQRFPGEHTRQSWVPVGRASMSRNRELPDD